jgi:hexosaminidase
MEYGRRAAENGCRVIMTPTSHCYFDYYQAKEGEPKAIGGYLPLEKVYEFNPMPDNMALEARPRILGGQGNIWTEYMPHSDHVEYMALPRMCAMSEALWSPHELRDFKDFEQRLKAHYPRFDLMNVFYRPHNR